MSGMSVMAYRASVESPEASSDASFAPPSSASSADSIHPLETTALSLSFEEQGMLEALLAGRLTQPFDLLGPRYASAKGDGAAVRCFHPGAEAVRVRCRHSGALLAELQQYPVDGQPSGFFSGLVPGLEQRRHAGRRDVMGRHSR